MKSSLSGRNGRNGRSSLSGLIGLICLMLLLTGCNDDPRKEAIAEKTRIEANQSALDAEQARAIKQQEADANQVRTEWWNAVWASGLENAKAGMRILVNVTSWMMTISICVVLVSFALTMKDTMRGIGQAAVVKAEVTANLIHLDKETGTYPMLRQVHGTRWALAVPNTGMVLMLDEKHEPDRQLVAAFAQACATGLIARQAGKGKADAAGMAMINPTVIDLVEGA